MKGESEKLEGNSFRVVHDGRIDRQEQLLRSYSARDTPVVSSPEILLDGVVDQVWAEITGRCPKKRLLENNILGSTSEGKEGNDEDERHFARGLQRKIGGSYDYGGAAANIKNTIHLESLS